MILDRYIRKVMFSNMIIVFLTLLSFSSIVRLIDELRKIGEYSFSLHWIIIYIFLSLPKDLELFLPMVILLGGLLSLGVFELHHEFMMMQMFGFSRLCIVFSVIRASIPILLCGVLSSEWVLPVCDKVLCSYKNDIKHDIKLASEKKSENFFWCIDKSCFVCIERILTCHELSGLTLYYFNKEKKLRKILFVEHASFMHNVWILLNVQELDFSKEAYVVNKKMAHLEWHAILTPDKLSMLLKHPNVLSISKLYYCIQYLNQVGQDSKYCQLVFWNKIFSPFFGFIMVITALSCTFGPLSQKKLSIRLFLGAIIGFIFYILNQFFGILSIAYIISPIIGSVLSAVIFFLINIIIIWKYH